MLSFVLYISISAGPKDQYKTNNDDVVIILKIILYIYI